MLSVPNKLTSLQTTLAAEARLAGQFLPQGCRKASDTNIQSRNLKTNSFQNRKAEFRAKVNLQ
jgi:hypothetical protein